MLCLALSSRNVLVSLLLMQFVLRKKIYILQNLYLLRYLV